MDDLTDANETEDSVSPRIFISVGLFAFAFSGFLVRKICSSLNEQEGIAHAHVRQLPNRVLNGNVKDNYIINFRRSELVQIDGNVSDDEVERHSRRWSHGSWDDADISYEVDLFHRQMPNEDTVTSQFTRLHRLRDRGNRDDFTFKFLPGDFPNGETDSKLVGRPQSEGIKDNVGQTLPTHNGPMVQETTDGTGDWRSSYRVESAWDDEEQIHGALRVTRHLSSKRVESFHYSTDDDEVDDDRPVSVVHLPSNHFNREPLSVMEITANNRRSEKQTVSQNPHNTLQQQCVPQLQHQLNEGTIASTEQTLSDFVWNNKFCFKPISESECSDFTTAVVRPEPESAALGNIFQGPNCSSRFIPNPEHMSTDISSISSSVNIRYEPHYAFQMSRNQDLETASLLQQQNRKQMITNMNDWTMQTKLERSHSRGNQFHSHTEDGETGCRTAHNIPLVSGSSAGDKLRQDESSAHAGSERNVISHHQASRVRNSKNAIASIPETGGSKIITPSSTNSKRVDDGYQGNGSSKGSKVKLRKTKKVTFNLHNEGIVDTGKNKEYSKEEIISESHGIGLGKEIFTVQVLSRSTESTSLGHVTDTVGAVGECDFPGLGVIIHQLPQYTQERQDSFTPYFVVGHSTLRVKIKGREIVKDTAKLLSSERDYAPTSRGSTRLPHIPDGTSSEKGDISTPNIAIESCDSEHSRHGHHLVVLNGTVLQPLAVSPQTNSKHSNERDILPGVLVPLSDSKRANLRGSFYQGHVDIPVPLISFSGDVYRVLVPKQAINRDSEVKKSLPPSSSLPGILVPLGVSNRGLSTFWPAKQGPEVVSESKISLQTVYENGKVGNVHSRLTQKHHSAKSKISGGSVRNPSKINHGTSSTGKVSDTSENNSPHEDTSQYEREGSNNRRHDGELLSQKVPYKCEYVAFGRDVFKVSVSEPLDGSNEKVRGYLTSLSPAFHLQGISGENKAINGTSTQSRSAKCDDKLVQNQEEDEEILKLCEIKQGKDEYRDILESELYQDLCSDVTKEKQKTRKIIVRNKTPSQSIGSLRSIKEETWDTGETCCPDNVESDKATSLSSPQCCAEAEIRNRTKPRDVVHASQIRDRNSDDFRFELTKEDEPKHSSTVTVCDEISNKKVNSATAKVGPTLSCSLVTHCLHNTPQETTIDVSNGSVINTTRYTTADCMVQSPLNNECVVTTTPYVSGSTPFTVGYSNGTKLRRTVNTINQDNDTFETVTKGNEIKNGVVETRRSANFIREDCCELSDRFSAIENAPEDKLKWRDGKAKVDDCSLEGDTTDGFMDVSTKPKKGKKVKVLQVPVSDPNLLRYAKIGPKRVVIVRDPKVIEAEHVKAQKKAQKKPKGRLVQLAPDNDDDRYSIQSGFSSQSLRRSFRRPAPRPGSPTSLPDQALVRGMNGRSSLPPNFRGKKPPDWDQLRGDPRQRRSTSSVDMYHSGKPRPPRSLPDVSSYQRDFPDGHTTNRKQIYDVPSNNQVSLNNAKRSERNSEKHYGPTGNRGTHSLPRNLPFHLQNGQQEAEVRHGYNRPRNAGSLPSHLQSHDHRSRSWSSGKIERGGRHDMQQHHNSMPRSSRIHSEDNYKNDGRYRREIVHGDQSAGSSKNLRLQGENGMGRRSASFRNVTPIEFDNTRGSQITTPRIEVNDSPVIDRPPTGREENHLRLPVSHSGQSDRGSSDENSVFSHGSQNRPRYESAFGEGESSGESQKSNEPKVIKAQDMRVETCFYWEPGLETKEEREKKKEREEMMGKETAGVFARSSGAKGSMERQLERQRRNEDLKGRAMMQGIPKQNENIYDKPVTNSLHPMALGSSSPRVSHPSNPADRRFSGEKLQHSNDPRISNDDYHTAQHYSKPFSQQPRGRKLTDLSNARYSQVKHDGLFEDAIVTKNVSGYEVPSRGKKVVGQPKETTFGVESNINVVRKETSLCDPPEESVGAVATQHDTVNATQLLERKHEPNGKDKVSISGSRTEPVSFQRMETSFSEPDGNDMPLYRSSVSEQPYQKPAPPNKPKSIETIFAEPEMLLSSQNRIETSFSGRAVSHKEKDTPTNHSEYYPHAQDLQINEFGHDNDGSHSSDDDSLTRQSDNESKNGRNSITPSRFGAVRVTQEQTEPQVQLQHRSQQHSVEIEAHAKARSIEVPNGSVQRQLGQPREVAVLKPAIQQVSDPSVQKTPKLAVPKPVQPAVRHPPRIAVQQPSKPVVLQRPKPESGQQAKSVAHQSKRQAAQQPSRMVNQQPNSASQQSPIPNAQSHPKPLVQPKPKIAVQQPRKTTTQGPPRMAVQQPQKASAQEEARIALQKSSKVIAQQPSQTVGQQNEKPQQPQRPLSEQPTRQFTQHQQKVAVSLPSKTVVDQRTTQPRTSKPEILKRPQNLSVPKPPAPVAQPHTIASQEGQNAKASKFVKENTKSGNFKDVNESAYCNQFGFPTEPSLQDQSKPTLHASDTNDTKVNIPNEIVDKESYMIGSSVEHSDGLTDRLAATTNPQPKPRSVLQLIQTPNFHDHVQEHVLPSEDEETMISPNAFESGPQNHIADDNGSNRSHSISSDSEEMEEKADKILPKKPFSTVFCLRGVKVNKTVIPLPQHSEVNVSISEPRTGYNSEDDAYDRSGYMEASQNEKIGNSTKTSKTGEPFKQQEDLISPLSISESSATTITEPDSDRDEDNSISTTAPALSLLNTDVIESERFDKKTGRPIPSPRPPLTIKPPGEELSKFKFEESEEQPEVPPPPQYSDDNENKSTQHPQTSSVYHPSVYMSNPGSEHPMTFGYKPSYSQNYSVTSPAIRREEADSSATSSKQYSAPDSTFSTLPSNVTNSDEKINGHLDLFENNFPKSPQMEIPEEGEVHKSNEGSNTVAGNEGLGHNQQSNPDRFFSYTYDQADYSERYQPYDRQPHYEYHPDISHHYHNAEVDRSYNESTSPQAGTMYYPAVDAVGYDEYEDGYSQSQIMPSASSDDYMHFSDLQYSNQPEYHSRAGTMYIPDLDEYDDDFDDDVVVGDTALDYFPDYAMEPVFQRLETIPEEVEPWSNDTSEYSSAEDSSSAEEGDVSVSPRSFDPSPSSPPAATLIEHVPLQDAMAAEVGSGVESESSSSTVVQNPGGETMNSLENVKPAPPERDTLVLTDESSENTAGRNEKKSTDPDFLFPSTDDIRRDKSPVSFTEISDGEDEEFEIEVCLDDDASENSAFIMEDGDVITDEESEEDADTDSKQSFGEDSSATDMNRSFVIALVGQTSIVHREDTPERTPVNDSAPLVENEDLEDSSSDDEEVTPTDHESPTRIISPLKIMQPMEEEVVKIAEVVEQTLPEEDKGIGVKATVSPTKAINLNYSKVPVKVIMSQTAQPQTVQYPTKIAVSEVATTTSVAEELQIPSKDEDVLSTIVKNTPSSFERFKPFKKEHLLNVTGNTEDVSEANETRTGDKDKLDPNVFSVVRNVDPAYKSPPQVNKDPFLLDRGKEKENDQNDNSQSEKPSRDRSGRRKFRKLQGNARAAIQDVITDLETNLGVEMSKEDKQERDSRLATTEFGKRNDIDQRDKEPVIQAHITEEQRSLRTTQGLAKPVQQKHDSVHETQDTLAVVEREAPQISTPTEKELPQESNKRSSDLLEQKECSSAQNVTAWHQDLDSVPRSPPITNPVVGNSNTAKNPASKDTRISAKPCPVFDIDSLKFEIPNYDKIFSEVKSQQKPVQSKKTFFTEPDVAPEISEELPSNCEYTDDGVIDKQLQRMRQNLKQMSLPDWFRKSPHYDRLVTSGNVRSLPSYWTFKPKRLTASTPATPTGERKHFSTISTQLPFLTAASFRRKDFSRPDDGRISPANSLPDSWTFDTLNVQTQGLSPNTSASPSPNQTKPSESDYNFKDHPGPRQLFQVESAEELMETEPPQIKNASMTAPNLPREMEMEDQHKKNELRESRTKPDDLENVKQLKKPTVNPAVRSASGSAVFCLTSSMFSNYSTPTPNDSNDHVNNNELSNSYLSSDYTGPQPAVDGGDGGTAVDYDVEISSSDEVFSSDIKPYYNPSSNWIRDHEDQQDLDNYPEEQPEAASYYAMQV